MIPVGLKYFHDFLSSSKNDFLKELVLKYNTTVFEKALNSNFAYGIRLLLKHGGSEEQLKSFPSLYLLIDNCEELHKLINF